MLRGDFSHVLSYWKGDLGVILVSCSENEKKKKKKLESKWIMERVKAGAKSESSKYWLCGYGACVGSLGDVDNLRDHHSICP